MDKEEIDDALTAPEKPPEKKRRKWKDLGPLDRLTLMTRWMALSVLFLFVGSILWAGVYRFVAPPGTLLMLERKLSGDVIIHPWTRIDDISPHLVTAVIAAEDTRFCLHNGIDFEAVNKAIEEAKDGGRQRGASTISQQTAKNAFLWNGRSWARKAGETWMTMVIETLWPKRRIIEVYLNLAEWGDGLFGAEAAARKRFGKSAKDLTPYEAALLATVLPNPHKWRVDPPGNYVRERVRIVQGRMGQVKRDRLDACVLKKGGR